MDDNFGEWVWLVGVVSRRWVWLVVRRYIDILTIIINFPYSTCISSFFGNSIPTSLFIFKMFFRLVLRIRIRNQNGDFLLGGRARKLRYYGDV